MKIDKNLKPVKYFLNRKKGLTKRESAIRAGYSDTNHTSLIEKTKAFQEIQNHFKDELLQQTSLQGLATELLKNVRQDKDLGAKNKAIEIALSKIEPDKVQSDDADKVLVILS